MKSSSLMPEGFLLRKSKAALELWIPISDVMLFCLWQGTYGIENDVFLSLPCVLSASGLTSVINQKLKDDEVAQLKKSADTLWSIQKDLKDL